MNFDKHFFRIVLNLIGIWFLLNIVIFIPLIDCGKCPPNNTINPCNCQFNSRINCIGDKVMNLTRIFQDLSLKLENKTDKEFGDFVLSNTAITELEDNSFHDITFYTIRLSNASKLNHISSKAFFPSNTEAVRKFVVEGYSSLGIQALDRRKKDIIFKFESNQTEYDK